MSNPLKVELRQHHQSSQTCEILGESDPTLRSLTEEYRRLSKLTDPTEADLEALAIILDLAQYDAALCCWIDRVDREVSEQLEITEPKQASINSKSNQAIVNQQINQQINQPTPTRQAEPAKAKEPFWFMNCYSPN